MVVKPKRFCAYPGCAELTDSTYCDKHTRLKNKKYQSYYDKNIRDKKAATFYNSQEWKKTRRYVLAKYKGLDLYAFFIENKIVYADAVHHIEELKEKWERRLDITNLIPLSSINHNKIDAMYKKDKKGTQKLLFELLDRWKKEYEGVGGR